MLDYFIVDYSVKISEDGIKALLALSGGDMRKVLNTLQSTWLAYRDVTEDNVYTCVGHPLRSDINNILNWLLNENDFAACFKRILLIKFFNWSLIVLCCCFHGSQWSIFKLKSYQLLKQLLVIGLVTDCCNEQSCSIMACHYASANNSCSIPMKADAFFLILTNCGDR